MANRLEPDELKRIRMRYGVMQNRWAALTGLATVSVNRWENGRVKQGKAVDTYYRLLAKPEVFELLTKMHSPQANASIGKSLGGDTHALVIGHS